MLSEAFSTFPRSGSLLHPNRRTGMPSGGLGAEKSITDATASGSGARAEILQPSRDLTWHVAPSQLLAISRPAVQDPEAVCLLLSNFRKGAVKPALFAHQLATR